MKRFILLFLAIVAMHNLWATTYIFTITSSDFNNTSYAANNGEHTSIARNPLNASDSRSVKWYSNQVMLMNGVIQFQKNSGYIYNITSLSYIKEVKVNSTDGTFTTYYGSEQHPTETISENPSFFTVQNGSTTSKVTSIVVTIEAQGGNNNGDDEKPGETANNVIAYTASEKLPETTNTSTKGLHTNAFNVSITSHTFSNGTGTITFSGEVTSIGLQAFYSCSGLTSITIPNSVTSIGSQAFEHCTGLTSITIPESVTSIKHNAFEYCTGLTSIVVESGNAKYDSRDNCNAIIETTSNTLIAGCKNTTIPNSVTSIGDWAFYSASLTSVTIPNSVTSIGKYAFYGCSGLTSITIPNSVTSIGKYAFCGCSGLTSITIPNSVTSIGELAFADCSGLTSITIPNSVTSIGEYAFYGCENLKTVYNASGLDIVKGTETYGYVAYYADNVYVPYKLSVTSSDEQKGIATAMLDGVAHPNDTTFWSNTEESYFIILTATAKNGNHFVQWSDGVTDNPRSFVLTQDTTFVAEFERNSYSVTVASSDLAKGIVAGDTTVLYGDTITISATPATGFQFNSWSDGDMDNPRIITLTQDTNLVAQFGTKMCTLTIISNIEEAADITGAGTYEYGTSVSCAVDVMTDYTFVKWGNGKTANPYKFKIYDDMTLYAFFAEEGGDPIAPDSVIVLPTDNDATLQWPQVDNAFSYTMTITKGGETICSLTFNGLGQLINIDFSAAPARAAAKIASATTGFNFTVIGLDSGTTYGYLIEAKDEKGEVISTEEGTFTTTGTTTSIEETTVNKYVNTATKHLRDGQLFILRDDKTYNMQGAVVDM